MSVSDEPSQQGKLGCPYGTHRVLDKKPCLPQQADKLDSSFPLLANEIGINVKSLNIDSASFRQMKNMTGSNPKTISDLIMKTVKDRGKQQNPVTGSGGMLVGEIDWVGAEHPLYRKFTPGEKVATLVSLSLTPLHLDEILGIHIEKDRVDVRGRAILFETGMVAKIPEGLHENTALSLFDVCGAPAQVTRAIHNKNFTVVIVGAGKSGMLSAFAARKVLENPEQIIIFDASEKAVRQMRDFGFNHSYVIDATDPLGVEAAVKGVSTNKMGDLVINTANVENTEMSCIMSAKSGGEVIFFSMSTSFTKVALGAEGIAKDVTLSIGSGYVPGHAESALELLEDNPELKEYFEENYGM